MSNPDLIPDPSRVKRFVNTIHLDYDSQSIIRKSIPYQEADAQATDNFVRIALRFYVGPENLTETYSGSTYYAPEVHGVGRSIAIGEERYLIEQFKKAFETKDVATKAQMLDYLERSPLLNFTAAFVPIEYFMDLHKSSDPRLRVEYEGTFRYLKFGRTKLRVFWSSNYVKFDEFFFLTEDSVKWLVKPDPETGHWVRVSIVPDKKAWKFDVTAETIAYVRVLSPEKAFAFRLAEHPT